MRLRDLSAIARPIDPRFSTNLAIVGITFLVVIGAFVVRLFGGIGLWSSAGAAAGLGLAVFLAWALCREIDPDRDLSAFVAAVTALLGTFLWGLPALAVLFWILLAVRIVNRTTGLLATASDSFAVFALSIWLTFRVWWPVGALAVLVFLLDGWLEKPNKRHRFFGIFTLAATLGAALLGRSVRDYSGPALGSSLLVLLMSLVFLPVLASADNLTSVADDTREQLNTGRVRAGQMIVLLTGITSTLWSGAEGLVMLWPLWSAVVGASAYLLIKSVTT